MASQTGSGFTNIQRILGANQGNQLGSAIKAGVGNDSDQFKNDLNSANSQFQSDIDKSKTDFEAGKEKQTGLLNQAKSLNGGQKLDDDKVQYFTKFTGGTYQGPTTLNNSDKLNSQAKQLQDTGNATKTQSGRSGLLQSYVGQGQYTNGQQQTDNLLLGQGQQNKQALLDTRKATAGLTGQINQANNVAQGIAQQTQNQQQTQRADLTNQAVTGATGITGGIQATLDEAKKNDPAKYARLVNEIKASGTTGTMTAEDAQALGLANGTNIYGLTGNDLATYLRQDNENLNMAGLTKQDQLAQYEALRQLGGNQAPADQYAGLTGDDVGKYKGVYTDANARDAGLVSAKNQYKDNLNTQGIGAGIAFNPDANFNTLSPVYGSNFTSGQAQQYLDWANSRGEGPDTQYTEPWIVPGTYVNPTAHNISQALNNFYSQIGKDRAINTGSQVSTNRPVGR